MHRLPTPHPPEDAEIVGVNKLGMGVYEQKVPYCPKCEPHLHEQALRENPADAKPEPYVEADKQA